ADARCEEAEELPHRGRVVLHDVAEVLARERERGRLSERRHRGRTLRIVEERELAEDVASARERDDDLLTALLVDRDLHGAARDEVAVPTGIVAMEDALVAPEVTRPHARRELGPLALRQRSEHRREGEILGDRVDVHA